MSCNEGNPPRIFFWQERTTFSDPDSHYSLVQREDGAFFSPSNTDHGYVETQSAGQENITVVANTETRVTLLRMEVIDDGYVYVKTQPLSDPSSCDESCKSPRSWICGLPQSKHSDGCGVRSTDSEPLQFPMDLQSLEPGNEGDTMEMPRLETAVSKNPQPSLSAVATTSFFKESPPTETQYESNSVTQCTGAYWNGDEFILDAHKGHERALFCLLTTVPVLHSLKRKHVTNRVIEQVHPKPFDLSIDQILVASISASIRLHPRGLDNEYNKYSTIEVVLKFDPASWECLLYWCQCFTRVRVRVLEGCPSVRPVIQLGHSQTEVTLNLQERKNLTATIIVNKVIDLQKLCLSSTCREDIYFEIVIELSIKEQPAFHDDGEFVIIKPLSR